MAAAFPRLRFERASRRMLYLRDQYQKAFPDESPLDPKRVAQWAYDQGLWKPIETDPREVLRRKIARALRHEYITDPQGREVRASIAQIQEVETPDGTKRMAIFYPTFEAPPDIAKQHYQLERRLAVENAVQLDLELESYNDNNVFGASLGTLDWNLKPDIQERGLPTDYDPYGDEEDDEE